MDSGATVDIMPEQWLPHVEIKPCSGVRKGRKLVAANNTPISEKGEKHVCAVTNAGQEINWPFIAGDVGKMLKSTATTCDEDNWVIFTKTGGWIVDTNTKEKIHFERSGNNYFMDLWVKVPDSVDKIDEGEWKVYTGNKGKRKSSPGFTGQSKR